MDKKDKALALFRDGYNCAQAVVMACAGSNDEYARTASGFGGGMGRMQKTCGAVTGAYMFFGLKHGTGASPTEKEKLEVYSRVKEFNRLFIERNGTDQCSVLLGEDINTPDGKARVKEMDLSTKVCEKCIADAVDIIQELG